MHEESTSPKSSGVKFLIARICEGRKLLDGKKMHVFFLKSRKFVKDVEKIYRILNDRIKTYGVDRVYIYLFILFIQS